MCFIGSCIFSSVCGDYRTHVLTSIKHKSLELQLTSTSQRYILLAVGDGPVGRPSESYHIIRSGIDRWNKIWVTSAQASAFFALANSWNSRSPACRWVSSCSLEGAPERFGRSKYFRLSDLLGSLHVFHLVGASQKSSECIVELQFPHKGAREQNFCERWPLQRLQSSRVCWFEKTSARPDLSNTLNTVRGASVDGAIQFVYGAPTFCVPCGFTAIGRTAVTRSTSSSIIDFVLFSLPWNVWISRWTFGTSNSTKLAANSILLLQRLICLLTVLKSVLQSIYLWSV